MPNILTCLIISSFGSTRFGFSTAVLNGTLVILLLCTATILPYCLLRISSAPLTPILEVRTLSKAQGLPPL